MKYLITGAGQIGAQLTRDLVAQGHAVTILRRGDGRTPSATTVVGDAADPDVVERTAEGAAAIFHCIHAAYDAPTWRRELPPREQTVMDAAATLGVPVVFPESVYAFGRAASDLVEGQPSNPCSPLGQVRAELLQTRAEHPATTLSIVASDLVGPTAGAGSVAHTTVLGPVSRGRRAMVLADPRLPHSWTAIPDLTRAMVHAAHHATALAPTGAAVLHAPTAPPVSIADLAAMAADILGRRPARVTAIPASWLHAVRTFHPMLRALDEQGYLWRNPVHLRPGVLTLAGMEPTPLAEVLEEILMARAERSASH